MQDEEIYVAPSLEVVGEFNDDTQGWGIRGYDLEDEFP